MTVRAARARWLVLAAGVGVALVYLYPDGYQQDVGLHYLFARWAWKYPDLLVGVWTRPLFTFLYSFPAMLGYPAAKLFTLAICLTTAYHTSRLAEQLTLPRAALAVPLLFLQPSFLMLSTETMTEPLFSLIFVLALRLHTAGRLQAGMVVASLLVLVRPEGFFLAVLWAAWILTNPRDSQPWWRRLPGTMLLAIGAALWWLAALIVTGDPLFIKHNWPQGWDWSSARYGTGHIWSYVIRLPEIAGLTLALVFLYGLWTMWRRREYVTLTTAFLTLFAVHTILRMFGWLGSAGYARYFVCVSPAVALITLHGWTAVAPRLIDRTRVTRAVVVACVWGLSALATVVYVDMAGWYGRDAHAIKAMHAWFIAHPQPVTRVIWTQAYMCIAFDRDPFEGPPLADNTDASTRVLRNAPPGTLVVWDAEMGPVWHGLKPADVEAEGFVRLYSGAFALDGWLLESRWLPFAKARKQEMMLFHKTMKQ